MTPDDRMRLGHLAARVLLDRIMRGEVGLDQIAAAIEVIALSVGSGLLSLAEVEAAVRGEAVTLH